MSDCERCATIPYPNIWVRFTAQDSDSNQLVEYRVQDMVEDDFDKVFEFMKSFFFKDEPMNASVNLAEDLDAYTDIKIVWKNVLSQKLSLICYKDGSDEVVGCNFLCLKKQSDSEEKIIVCILKIIFFKLRAEFFSLTVQITKVTFNNWWNEICCRSILVFKF